MPVVSEFAVYDALIRSGANQQQANIMMAIAGATTGYNTSYNQNGSVGIFAIPAKLWQSQGFNSAYASNLDYSASFAFQVMSRRGLNYGVFPAYSSGGFRNFLAPNTSQFTPSLSQGARNQLGLSPLPQSGSKGVNAPNTTGSVNAQTGQTINPDVSFIKPAFPLAPTADVTSFLKSIDYNQLIVDPSVVNLPPGDSLSIPFTGQSIENPIDYVKGFIANLFYDLGAIILDGILIITGVIICWKVVNALTNVNQAVGSVGSFAATLLQSGAVLLAP